MPEDGTGYVFIVGSPRSGTTYLAEVLARHPDIAFLYEPYFLWEFHSGNGSDDRRTVADLTGRARSYIRREFALFHAKSGRRLLLEKTPENAFKIPLMRAVFPAAKFLHLVRDGRDCVISINREWRRRSRIVRDRDFQGFWKSAAAMLGRQPFWRNRLQAIWFELSNVGMPPTTVPLNKAKWKGNVGWGPRFPGWEGALAAHSVPVFNALQWKHSVESVLAEFELIPTNQCMEIRYEALLSTPDPTLEAILSFMGAPVQAGLAHDLQPAKHPEWPSHFTAEQIAEIHMTIGPLLTSLGYPTIASEAHRAGT